MQICGYCVFPFLQYKISHINYLRLFKNNNSTGNICQVQILNIYETYALQYTGII